tara:strand:- start:1588 stop:2121 length:534 start_codon:yes stop_codon:yes gene_type:complete
MASEETSEIAPSESSADQFAVSPELLSTEANEGTEKTFLEVSEEMEQETREKILGDKNEVLGYISNDVYKQTAEDYDKGLVIDKSKDEDSNTIMDLQLSDIIKNTVDCLANFENEYIRMLYRYDLEYGKGDKGTLNTLKKYIYSFIMYLNDKDNILYIGITLFIISIILYFINITRQ